MIEMVEILRKLSKNFPKRLAAGYDHVGLQTGKKPGKVQKIFLSLDLDWEVLPLVKEFKPDVIITHHPFIFGTRARVLKRDESKRLLVEEIDRLGIPVYSFHTNFDAGKGGINDSLAKELCLNNVYAPVKDMTMRIGELNAPISAVEFAKLAKTVFHVDYALLINSGAEMIKKVGIIGGGGSRSWPIAKEEGCDIYISGDAPHHVRREIVNAKFNYLDMPHEIEKIFMPTMKNILLSYNPTLEIMTVDHEKLPKVIQ